MLFPLGILGHGNGGLHPLSPPHSSLSTSLSPVNVLFFFFLALLKGNLKIILFSFGCARTLLLHRLLSGCGDWGLLSSCDVQTSIAVFSLVAEHWL